MDPRLREELRRKVSSGECGADILAFLDANGLELNRYEALRGGPDYFLFLRLTPELKHAYGVTGDELLLLVLHHEKQQLWFLPEIRSQLKSYDRLTKTAVVVISPDPRIAGICRAAFSDIKTGYKTAHVAITRSTIRAVRDAASRKNAFFKAFSAQAFTVDHFDTRGPVPDDMFGRAALLTQSEADVRQSNEGIALLGVRRVGKTSVLKQILQQLRSDPDESWIVAYYDAQSDTVGANVDTVAAGLTKDLRLGAVERQCPIPGLPKELGPAAHLKEAMSYLMDNSSVNVALAIDEIEWLVPTPGSVHEIATGRSALALFGLLRSLKQSYGRRVALLVCGINEGFCELPRINDLPNPNLDWYRTRYVGLLSKKDTFDMLTTLGARMGLSLAPRFMERVWAEFGGHAYLARQFCSEAAKHLNARPARLDEQEFDASFDEFFARASTIFEEILKHLAQFYPSEYALLRRIASEPGLKLEASHATRHLKNYGLVHVALDGSATIPIGSFARFISSRTIDVAHQDRFKELAEIGRGVTSIVYKAWDRELDHLCAVKVFTSDDSETRARAEMDLLNSINSPFVPRAACVTKYADKIALVMDYVNGDSLETLLKERGRIAGDDLVRLSHNLLAAVESIHPRVTRLKELRAKEELSQLGYVELMDLMDRGHLHRDLKPANIIIVSTETWDLKMIDMGVAAPVARAKLTRIGTPAYQPRDVGINKWDPSFDLFAVGAILFECVFGQVAGGDDVDRVVDASSIKDPGYRAALKSFFNKALADTASERFSSATEMREAWEHVLPAAV